MKMQIQNTFCTLEEKKEKSAIIKSAMRQQTNEHEHEHSFIISFI